MDYEIVPNAPEQSPNEEVMRQAIARAQQGYGQQVAHQLWRQEQADRSVNPVFYVGYENGRHWARVPGSNPFPVTAIITNAAIEDGTPCIPLPGAGGLTLNQMPRVRRVEPPPVVEEVPPGPWFYDLFGSTVEDFDLETGYFRWVMSPPLGIPLARVPNFNGNVIESGTETGQFSAGIQVSVDEDTPFDIDIKLTTSNLGLSFNEILRHEVGVLIFRLRDGVTAPSYETMFDALDFAAIATNTFYPISDAGNWFGSDLSNPSEKLAWLAFAARGVASPEIVDQGWELYQSFSLSNVRFSEGSSSIDREDIPGTIDLTFDPGLDSIIDFDVVSSSATVDDFETPGITLDSVSASGTVYEYFQSNSGGAVTSQPMVLIAGTYLFFATTLYAGEPTVLNLQFPGEADLPLPPDQWEIRVAIGDDQIAAPPPWR